MNKIVVILILIFLNFGLFLSSSFSQTNNRPITQDDYTNTLAKQNQIHNFIRIASKHEKAGQHRRALENYIKAYEINQCAGLIAVCRGGMADNYEALGDYDKALEHVDWFLAGLNPKEPLFEKMSETKSRLLKKIEEQKQNANTQNNEQTTMKKDPVVEQIKENFPKATHEEQHQFLESMGGPGVWDAFRKAMTLEHDGNFKEALSVYESLLPEKEAITKQMGIDGWVMLYPAIQRNAEQLGDAQKEKEALLWMKDNLLNSGGAYYASVSKLKPEVVQHIQDRVQAVISN